jgi:proline iminopeptidase
LLPNPETVAAFSQDRLALGLARIESHFFSRHLFTGECDLIARVGQIRHLPAAIVQGRYDIVCPVGSADEIVGWPNEYSEIEWVLTPSNSRGV